MRRSLLIILCLTTIGFGISKKYKRPQVNTVGLIGHWKLHDGSAFDYSLNNHSGTLTGTTLTYKYPGLDLEGADEHIVIADHADFTPALSALTISAWVKMDDATNFIIASKGVIDTDGEWMFYCDAIDKIAFFVSDEDQATCYIGRTFGTALPQNLWTHVLGTYGGGATSASFKIYRNGVRIDDANFESNQGNFTTAVAGGHDVWLGNYGGVFANGIIDDVMIFAKELSTAEAKSIYEVTRWRYDGQ